MVIEGFDSPPCYKLKQTNMNIIINYDGSTAVCKINGKPINKASVLEITQTLSAFRTIENAYKREQKTDLQLSWLEQQTHNHGVVGSSPTQSAVMESIQNVCQLTGESNSQLMRRWQVRLLYGRQLEYYCEWELEYHCLKTKCQPGRRGR